jgi:predicted acylesterase/phospholipase RssA
MNKRLVRWGVLVAAIAALAIAATLWALRAPTRLPAVPEELTTRAEVPGIPNARYWVMSGDLKQFVRDVMAARDRESTALASAETNAALPPADLLAISGGGDKGAFGAGLLCGWTDAGNRPTFKAVTGVSTGALIAPFAFLGPEYDHVLRKVYTSISLKDIARKRSVLAAINNDGMADNRPLWELISQSVDATLLARIATEHGKGRLLLIGTTNLDARQPVVWNVGTIASSGSPEALELIRKILLASAAIPGAFPPSMIHVEVDGRAFEEMHVDGGASAQVFLYPPGMRTAARVMGEEMSREGHVYIIRNSRLPSTWAPVDRKTINIAGRAIDSLIHTQGIGDLYRIYATTQRDQLDFNLAYIGGEFSAPRVADFDTAYMQALFDYGYKLGRGGYPWHKLPPGLEETPASTVETATAANP